MCSFDGEWFRIERLAPPEIVLFLKDIFKIYEIRGRIGREKGIRFEIHTNEKNHAIPHIHAEYGEYSIEIRIDNQEILSGNLPVKQQNVAKKWVLNNKEKLVLDWKNIAISPISDCTVSALDLEK